MQKYLVYLLYKIEANVWRSIAIAVVAVAALWMVFSTTWLDTAYYMVADRDDNRGAIPLPADALGDAGVSKIVYLSQNWDSSDSLWFYNITQGSDLLPYDFFIALERPSSQELFRSVANMNRFRYLPQGKTAENPDALPVGMVADKYRGKKYMGFNCSACHTSQVNYNGVGIRIDGGSGAADMDGFMVEMQASLEATGSDSAKQQRFVDAVLKAGSYHDKDSILKDLATYTLQLKAYNYFNKSETTDDKGNVVPVDYGYARLDAFGRIYNRVLEHLVNPDVLQIVLKSALPPESSGPLLDRLKPVLSEEDRERIMRGLMATLKPADLDKLKARVFNSPNSPVSYPFLWDIPQHDYVQWNGIGINAGAGPLGRNTGEVLGVFATLDWVAKDWPLPASLPGWLGIGPKNIVFQSSVKAHNLRQIEDRLWKLWSPKWSDAVLAAGLPPINPELQARGEYLFDRKCASCHALIDSRSPDRRIVAHMDKVETAGTDPTMARRSVAYEGYSGILRNQYVTVGTYPMLLDTRAPVAALLTSATQNVVATPDPDKWFFTRFADWAVDLIRGIFSNKIKSSVKSGDYIPDTTAAPVDSLMSYKGRSLNGIWATAPYLHNGSVPTLYDLLLPADPKDGDPPGTQYRPKTFMVGSRELDTEKVGFKSDASKYPAGSPAFKFDTAVPGNGNAGHEYSTRELTDLDRRALVEYMKGL
jgi:hypothetical protein